MTTLAVMTSANLFVGDHDPSNSKHLTLTEIKLPDLQAIYGDHHAGGAKVGIEVELGVQKLESTFKLGGWDPSLLQSFGLGAPTKKTFTVYGKLTDREEGKDSLTKAVIFGRLGKVAPDAYSRGDVQGHEYGINSITHYELYVDDQELIYWDWRTGAYRLGGVEQTEERFRSLFLT